MESLIINVESVLYVRKPARADRAAALSGMAALTGAKDEKLLAKQLNWVAGNEMMRREIGKPEGFGPLELCRALLCPEDPPSDWQFELSEARLREIFPEFIALYARYMGEAKMPRAALATLRALKARGVRLYYHYNLSLWDMFTDGFLKSELIKAFDGGQLQMRTRELPTDARHDCREICLDNGIAPEECGFVSGQLWRDVSAVRDEGLALILYRPEGQSAREKRNADQPDALLRGFEQLTELPGLPD